MSDDQIEGGFFLIVKNGWYYRPDAAGYTGRKSEAGRYSFDDAAEYVGPNGPDGPQDGLEMWAEADAPEYSSSCPYDVKLWDKAFKAGADACAAQLKAAVLAEREACASVVEELWAFRTCQEVSDAIRSRKAKEQAQ